MKVRIGFAAGVPTPVGPETFGALVDQLEESGFDSLWLPEVLSAQSLDNLAAVAFAAARAPRLKLGTHVTMAGRNPFRLAKELATLDRLSGGRLLLMGVIGLNEPAELAAMGTPGAGRTAQLEATIALLRRFWSGEPVTELGPLGSYDAAVVWPTPLQDPLEIWLGGVVPAALERAGRLSDGWMPPPCLPTEAAERRARVLEAAAKAGRVVDAEHFGMNVTYAIGGIDDATRARLSARRVSAGSPDDLVPTSFDALRARLDALVDVGFSKFVLRPATPPDDWHRSILELADHVLDLQT